MALHELAADACLAVLLVLHELGCEQTEDQGLFKLDCVLVWQSELYTVTIRIE